MASGERGLFRAARMNINFIPNNNNYKLLAASSATVHLTASHLFPPWLCAFLPPPSCLLPSLPLCGGREGGEGKEMI